MSFEIASQSWATSRPRAHEMFWNGLDRCTQSQLPGPKNSNQHSCKLVAHLSNQCQANRQIKACKVANRSRKSDWRAAGLVLCITSGDSQPGVIGRLEIRAFDRTPHRPALGSLRPRNEWQRTTGRLGRGGRNGSGMHIARMLLECQKCAAGLGRVLPHVRSI